MAPPKISEAEKELLSEEELAGLLSEDDDDDGEGDDTGEDGDGDDAGNEDDDTGADDDGDGSGEGDDDGAGDADAAGADADAAAKADAAATGAADDAGQGSDDEVVEKAPSWLLPADTADKLKAFDEQRDTLTEKFDEGELTASEYRTQMKAIDTEARQIERAQIVADVQKANAIETWKSDVARFITDHPEYRDGSPLNTMLDAEVRRLQTESVNPLNPALLQKAHDAIAQRVKAAYGVEQPEKKPKPAAGDKKQDVKKPGKRPEPPPTLANIPATDATDADDGGEFGFLDRLAGSDSVKYEAELAKLQRTSPEKFDRYMAQ